MAVTKNCTLSPSEVAAQYAEHVCNDDRHGYSQPGRKGDGTYYKFQLSDGSFIDVDGGDIDCSELALDCYRNQGIDVGGASYSRNMDLLLDTGNFVDVGLDPSNWTRGDLLVVPGHVAVWLGNGMLAEAHHGDFAGGLDGYDGDQDGSEVRVRSYYDDGWTNVFHCILTRFKPSWIHSDTVDRWWYRHADGTFTTNGWEHIDGHWYYFDKDGYMVTGWLQLDEDDPYSTKGYVWYYLNEKADGSRGQMYEDRWLKDPDGSWYYFDASGRMVRNSLVSYGGGFCAIGADGRAVRDGVVEGITVSTTGFLVRGV